MKRISIVILLWGLWLFSGTGSWIFVGEALAQKEKEVAGKKISQKKADQKRPMMNRWAMALPPIKNWMFVLSKSLPMLPRGPVPLRPPLLFPRLKDGDPL